jgi:hypothetical protein
VSVPAYFKLVTCLMRHFDGETVPKQLAVKVDGDRLYYHADELVRESDETIDCARLMDLYSALFWCRLNGPATVYRIAGCDWSLVIPNAELAR